MSQARLTNSSKTRDLLAQGQEYKIEPECPGKLGYQLSLELNSPSLPSFSSSRSAQTWSYDRYQAFLQRPHVARNPMLEETLSTWVSQCQTYVAQPGEIIKVKAKVFSERLGLPAITIKLSRGWLQRFQKRNKLRIRIHEGVVQQMRDP